MLEVTPESCFVTTDNADGTINISQFICAPYIVAVPNTNATNTITDIVIPRTINGKTVTTIGDLAFAASEITSVVIPDTVTIIGEEAFGSNSLKSIEIPDSLTTIGSDGFNNNLLTSVVIPENVMHLGYYVFNGNQLTSVTIKGKSSSADFTTYNDPFYGSWAKGYSYKDIIWEG